MDSKLKELVLYIADKCKDDPSFGATKLNKILFLSDINSYASTGKPITDSIYIHKPNGPVAKRLLPAVHSLKKEKRAETQEDEYFGYIRRRVVPLKGPNASLFDEKELKLVDTIIEQTRSMTATQLSEWTHSLKPWLLTTDGEEIPFFSVFGLYRLPVEADGINWAKKELQRIKKQKNAAAA